MATIKICDQCRKQHDKSEGPWWRVVTAAPYKKNDFDITDLDLCSVACLRGWIEQNL